MSEKQKYCPRCDRQTPHEQWSHDEIVGESTAGRVFGALFTWGLTELMRETSCECLRCGYQRKVR